MIYDLAIVGQGIAGLAIGFRIKGLNVVVIGKSDDTASRCATGVTTHKGLKEIRGELFRLKTEGYERLPKWIFDIEQATHQNIPIVFGIEEFFLNDEDGRGIQQRIYKDEPLAKFDVAKTKEGFFYPNDFVFDVEKLLLALRIFARKNHTVIAEHVHNIHRKNTWYEVDTDSSRLRAKNILLACGESSNFLLTLLRLPILNLSLLAGKTFFGDFTNLNNFKGYTHRGHNLVLSSSGYRLGSTSRNPENPDTLDFRLVSAHFKFELIEQQVWKGQRARFKDRLPQVLEIEKISENQRVFFVGGFYKSGFQFADLMAQKFLTLF